MLEDKKLYKVKTQLGVIKFSRFEKIRSGYLYRMRGLRILDRFYGGIGGPKRQSWYIKIKMNKRFGIGLKK